MRELTEVIDQMIVAIPREQEMLLCDLGHIKSSAMTAAPEMMRHWWLECGQGAG